MPKRATEDRALDPYGHRGKGGVWRPGLGPCICGVCEQERAAALNARVTYRTTTEGEG